MDTLMPKMAEFALASLPFDSPRSKLMRLGKRSMMNLILKTFAIIK